MTYKIAVTGIIGSGKSTFAELLTQELRKLSYHNVQLVSVDQLVDDAYRDPNICQTLRARYNTASRIKLGKLWEKMDESHRLEFEAVFTKHVMRGINDELDHAERNGEKFLVVEFPLLFEKNAQAMFDTVVCVRTNLANVVDRVRHRALRQGKVFSQRRLDVILARQLSQDEKANLSTYVVNNTSSTDHLTLAARTLASNFNLLANKLKELPSRGETILNELKPLSSQLVKRESLGVVAGSFDPITFGHLWVIEKSLAVLDRVAVLVAHNPAKQGMFTPHERVTMILESIEESPTLSDLRRSGRLTVNILTPGETTANAAIKIGQVLNSTGISIETVTMVRGIRTASDLEYENVLNLVQARLAPEVTTWYLMPPRELIEVSSSMVKSLVGVKGWNDVAHNYVPTPVVKALAKKISL